MPRFERPLRALRYPGAESFDAGDEAACRHLIAWLEMTHIRHWQEEQRRPLKDIQAKTWRRTLEEVGAEAR